MVDVEKKRQRERDTVREIIKIYCHGHHHERNGAEFCPDCQKIADYADARIAKCPRMDIKTFCNVCPIHCYAPQERAQIRRIMAYSGPRMLLHHPLMTLRHMLIQWETKRGLRQHEAVVAKKKKAHQS